MLELRLDRDRVLLADLLGPPNGLNLLASTNFVLDNARHREHAKSSPAERRHRRRVVELAHDQRVDPLRLESPVQPLVYPDDAGHQLGAALLGSRTGEVVSFDVPVGTHRLRIERILYQPEAAGDLHL